MIKEDDERVLSGYPLPTVLPLWALLIVFLRSGERRIQTDHHVTAYMLWPELQPNYKSGGSGLTRSWKERAVQLFQHTLCPSTLFERHDLSRKHPTGSEHNLWYCSSQAPLPEPHLYRLLIGCEHLVSLECSQQVGFPNSKIPQMF